MVAVAEHDQLVVRRRRNVGGHTNRRARQGLHGDLGVDGDGVLRLRRGSDVGVDDDVDAAAGSEELVELTQNDDADAAPPHDEETERLRVPGNDELGLGDLDGAVDPAVHERVVVRCDGDDLVASFEHRVRWRVQFQRAVGALAADDGGLLEALLHHGVAVACHALDLVDVDLVAVEVEQLLEHVRESGLTARLRGDLGDRDVGVDRDDAPDQLTHGEGDLPVDDLGDERPVELGVDGAHGEEALHDGGVAVLTAEHHDGAGRLDADATEVVGRSAIARSHDDARALGVADALGEHLVDVALVVVDEEHDGGVRLVLVGDDQLADEGEDLTVPAEHERVVVLDDLTAALGQLVDLAVDGVGDETDEAAGDEDAGEGDEEPEHSNGPLAVTGERAGVEDAQHRLPRTLDPVRAFSGGGERPDRQGQRCGEDDDDDRDQSEPGDDADGALGDRLVELVAEPCSQSGVVRAATDTGLGARGDPTAASVAGLALLAPHHRLVRHLSILPKRL